LASAPDDLRLMQLRDDGLSFVEALAAFQLKQFISSG
jgi:hypothetical protein